MFVTKTATKVTYLQYKLKNEIRNFKRKKKYTR